MLISVAYSQTRPQKIGQAQLFSGQWVDILDNGTWKKSSVFGTFKDPRDGRVYRTVIIGKQFWMKENLAFKPSSGNFWAYDNDPSNIHKYGYLYDWHTANKVCPPGWHLPSDAEWKELTDFLGGKDVAGGKMKSTVGWKEPNADATNSSGFSGLPSGFRGSFIYFNSVGGYGGWWSSTERDNFSAWNRYLNYSNGNVNRFYANKTNGRSCRCLKD